MDAFAKQDPTEAEIRDMYRKLAEKHDLPADVKVPGENGEQAVEKRAERLKEFEEKP